VPGRPEGRRRQGLLPDRDRPVRSVRRGRCTPDSRPRPPPDLRSGGLALPAKRRPPRPAGLPAPPRPVPSPFAGHGERPDRARSPGTSGAAGTGCSRGSRRAGLGGDSSLTRRRPRRSQCASPACCVLRPARGGRAGRRGRPPARGVARSDPGGARGARRRLDQGRGTARRGRRYRSRPPPQKRGSPTRAAPCRRPPVLLPTASRDRRAGGSARLLPSAQGAPRRRARPHHEDRSQLPRRGTRALPYPPFVTEAPGGSGIQISHGDE
jgi:hypothetical protein